MTAQALFSPAAERNSAPILEVLRRVLPATGLVLEIASGTGQHAAYLSRALPGLTWRPSDPDADARASISAFAAQENLPNVLPPLELDVQVLPWPIATADALVCINMIHISPWAATLALMSGANAILPEGGVLYLYGPHRVHGHHTAPTNERFDASLRSQNPEWGVRDLDDVVRVAAAESFELLDTVEMPANNLSVVFARRGSV